MEEHIIEAFSSCTRKTSGGRALILDTPTSSKPPCCRDFMGAGACILDSRALNRDDGIVFAFPPGIRCDRIRR